MQRIIVAITGASGVIYGICALKALKSMPGIETHLVMSSSAMRTIKAETDYSAGEVNDLADSVHKFKDIGAAIASGSFRTLGMLVAPCSIKTLSGIAHSYNEDLVVRAADVCLKERRRVVLLLRETPLHAGHIRLMAQAAECGAIIMPPVPAFYQRPQSVQELVDHTVARALDLFDVDLPGFKRWGEELDAG